MSTSQQRRALDAEIRGLISVGKRFSLTEVEQFLKERCMQLNAVSRTHVMSRLSEVYKKGDAKDRPLIQTVAREVLCELLDAEERPGTREIATITYAVGTMQLQDSKLIDCLLRRIKSCSNGFNAEDYSFLIGGLASMPDDSGKRAGLLHSCCSGLGAIVSTAKPETILQCLQALCQNNCFEPSLVEKISDELVARHTLDKKVSACPDMESIARLVRLSAMLRCAKHNVLDYVTKEFEEARLLPEDTWRRSLSPKAAADFLWGCAAASYKVPDGLIDFLRQYIFDWLDSITDDRSRMMVTAIGTPAVLALSGEVDVPLCRELDLLEKSSCVDSFTSFCEGYLGDELQQLFPGRVETQVAVGPYRLDFVVKDGTGRWINVEMDGDEYHCLYDISSQELTPTYAGNQVVRDAVVSAYGYEVIRIRASEWQGAVDKEQLLLEKLD